MNEGMADCGKASNAMYSARGCRCAACRAAHLAAYHERIRRRRSGQKYFVEAGPVRAKLEHLYEVGYSIKELGRMGVPKSTQYALTHAHSRSGKPLTRVNREVAQRIDEIAGRALAPAQVVPGDAAAYLVRRWADSGISVAAISRETGISRQTLDALRHGRRKRVKSETLMTLLNHRRTIERFATA